MADLVCVNGHVSADPEWCDTCGAPMGASGSSTPASGGRPSARVPTTVAPVACPHCGDLNPADNLFCESCGYDFVTGQVPEAPEPPPAVPATTAHASEPAAPEQAPGSPWVIVIEVDPAWFALKGDLADQSCPPASTSTVSITAHVALIGRTSQSRNVRPEVALDADSAVSRRHAQLLREGDQLSVVDLSSTNGTYVLSGSEPPSEDLLPIAPGVPAVLHDGDRIHVGAWTKLTVRAG